MHDVAVRRGVQWIAIATVVVWAGLALTGVVLFFTYRPEAAASFDSPNPFDRDAWLFSLNRSLHRVLSQAAILLPVVATIVAVVQRSFSKHLIWIPVLLLTLGASFTGYLLPWDQLALWAVTVGTDMRGFIPVFDDNVRFVLLGGVEIGSTTFRRWAVVHMIVLPVIALLLTIANQLWIRRFRSDDGASLA